MNAAATVAGSILASAGIAIIVVALTRPEPSPELDASQWEAVRLEQEQLRRDLLELDRKLDAMAMAASRTAVPEITDEQLERVVARVMQAGGEPLEAVADPLSGDLDLQAIYTSLLGSNPDEFQDVWLRVKEAGKLDELLALFEQYAEANPTLTQAHMDLGNAYLQKLMSMPPSPQSGLVATQAEAAFGRVLELDPNHWAARFTRAMSYSFWPDFLGKKQQAIDQFEILIGQQEQLPSQPNYAQTYLFLGNLYEQRGDLDKAAEIWKKGLSFFPADADLKGKVK